MIIPIGLKPGRVNWDFSDQDPACNYPTRWCYKCILWLHRKKEYHKLVRLIQTFSYISGRRRTQTHSYFTSMPSCVAHLHHYLLTDLSEHLVTLCGGSAYKLMFLFQTVAWVINSMTKWEVPNLPLSRQLDNYLQVAMDWQTLNLPLLFHTSQLNVVTSSKKSYCISTIQNRITNRNVKPISQ